MVDLNELQGVYTFTIVSSKDKSIDIKINTKDDVLFYHVNTFDEITATFFTLKSAVAFYNGNDDVE